MVLTPDELAGTGITVTDTASLPYFVVGQALEPFANPLPFSMYFPFDPNNPQLTTKVMDRWPYKEITISDGKMRAYYSPNVHKIMLEYFTGRDETGTYLTAIPVLIVDYGTPIRAMYAGLERPPDRPLEQQLEDWKKGYMLSRMKSPNKTITVTGVDPCAYRSPQFGCIPKTVNYTISYPVGWYWVQFKARLLTLPPQLLTIDRDILIFTYERPGEADSKLVGRIIDYLEKRKLKKDLPTLLSLLNSAGLEVDESQVYEYKGKLYRGIKIFVSEDGKSYEVLIPVRRKASAQLVYAIPSLLPKIVMAIVIIGSLLIIRDMVFAWKEVKLAQAKASLDKIYITRDVVEQLNKTIEEIKKLNIPDDQKAQLLNEALKYYGGTIIQLSRDPSGESLFEGIDKYLKYAAVGAGALALLYIIPKVIKSWRELSKP